MKTQVDDYTQPMEEIVEENTQDLNLETHQQNPQLLNLHFELTSACNERCIHCYQISCPVMKANKDDYKDVLLYAKSLNVKAQTDYIMMARADLETDNLANRMSIPETEKLLRELIEYNVDYRENALEHLMESKEEKEFDLERYKNQPLCGAATDSCCIAENGDVYPCSGWQAFVLGNVNEQSLRDIWSNSANAKRLRKITQSDFPQCLACEARDYCSRCLVRSFNECDGDMFALPKHFCDVAFLNKKLVEEYRDKGLL